MWPGPSHAHAHAFGVAGCAWTPWRIQQHKTAFCVQRLAGTVVHLKMTGAQHHEVVVSKNRTVTFCSVGKLVILLVMFAVQPVVLNAWFSKRGKY